MLNDRLYSDVYDLEVRSQHDQRSNVLYGHGYDNQVRSRDDERLDQLFERRCDELVRKKGPTHAAVVVGGVVCTYRDLDRRSNQLARYLKKNGVGPGDRIGLMLKQSVDTYTALLAILKLNAAYVPLDASFPSERITYIAKDAAVTTIISTKENRQLRQLPLKIVYLDDISCDVANERCTRLTAEEKGSPTERLCYIIYTSGSTGHPKGVAVEHPSICNFVKVAAEVYGYTDFDRVYQGMTIAFDFSVEEIWVPLIAGATLVPGNPETPLAGSDLAEFLSSNQVTALCCVPTLLATIDTDLPELRFLLVSGEACPSDLVVRWHRPGRTMLNAYGPTEATVTATLTELRPEKPVTIGVPLPTYTVVILDECENRLAPKGALGEIGIAGICLARGYVNRPDLTEKAFIPDFLNLANNPSKRIYRTGDLGRINEGGEIEYHGRIDAQVKIRGYRIELTEIESVLMEIPQIAQAIVATFNPSSGPAELVAYCTLKQGILDLPHEAVAALLRSRLPGYMIPTYVEVLPNIPMLPSNKADRKSLPPPTGPRFVTATNGYVAARDDLEQHIAHALSEILRVDRVSIEDDFFADLGAHSLLMARLSTAIRHGAPRANVSMRDIYLNPSVAKLARLIRSTAGAQAAPATAVPYRVAPTLEYYACAVSQLLFYTGFAWLLLEVFVFGSNWLLAATDLVNLYVRVVSFTALIFVAFSALPVAAKWILVGKWKAVSFPIWGLTYFRFWLVKSLIQSSPILLFQGTVVYNLYLRLLGAKIGRDVVIQCKSVPVCTDLLTIGNGTVLAKYSLVKGYKAQSGYIYTGPVTMGENAYVGEASVLDIFTRMEDRSQLGHSSSVPSGMKLDVGRRYHGSPAVECSASYNRIEPLPISQLRKALYPTLIALVGLLAAIPLIPVGVYLSLPWLYGSNLHHFAASLPQLSCRICGMIFFGLALGLPVSLIIALSVIAAAPRVLNLFLEKDAIHPLYGIRYFIYSVISTMTNSVYFSVLFGDSSAIVYFLRLAGYKLQQVVQTGSNFGTEQIHDVPYLCTVGSGTMVSSRLTMLNAQFSNRSFKLSDVTIGANNFLGNVIHFKPNAKVGDNCLLGSKVMVPIDGPMRENVGLLGSPSFEIPRSSSLGPNEFQRLDAKARKSALHAKNTFNCWSQLEFLVAQWVHLSVAAVIAYAALNYYVRIGDAALFLGLVGELMFSMGYLIFCERLSLGFRRLKPTTCTILDVRYWRIERHWKFTVNMLLTLFKGTPVRSALLRALGARIGKKVFDDGSALTERTLVEIGDYCTLNEFAIIQSHTMEDGIFKSDYIKIGKGCTVAANCLVYYGVVMADNSILDTDSLLMKGEAPGPQSIWRGNPARQV